MPSPDEAILAAHRHSHMSLPDMARALGLSVSRVSRIVAGARESRAFDRTEGAAQ
jgi:plasmid maintenance system antidote protein VapI